MNLSTRFTAVPVIRQSDLVPFAIQEIQHQDGFPIYNNDAQIKRLDLSKIEIKNPSKTYFVQLENDPFPSTKLRPESIMIIEKDKAPRYGSIILAWLEGEFVIRKYQIENVYPRLVCSSQNYQNVEIEPDMEFWVWGVVINCQ